MNGPAGAAEDAAADPMSKDMKGIAEEEGRGGWNGAAGKRRCWTLGLDVDPPEGKTTGGIAKSFVIFARFEISKSKLGFNFSLEVETRLRESTTKKKKVSEGSFVNS